MAEPATRPWGSFPFMELAALFELDYGDVLLTAYRAGERRRGRRLTRERHEQCEAAEQRIRDVLPAPRMFFDLMWPIIDARLAAADPQLPPTDPDELRALKFRGPIRYYDGRAGWARQEYEWPKNTRFGYRWQASNRKDKGTICYTVDGEDCPDIEEAVRRLQQPRRDDSPASLLERSFSDPQWVLENHAEGFASYGPFGGVKAANERAGNAWHGGVNEIAEAGRQAGDEFEATAWAYRAKDLGYEAPRIFYLIRRDRKEDQGLTCAMGVRLRECVFLRTVQARMEADRVRPPGLLEPPDILDDDIDMAKAWMCISHILRHGDDYIEGFVNRADDRP